MKQIHIPVVSQGDQAILVFEKKEIQPIWEITLKLAERTEKALFFDVQGCVEPCRVGIDAGAEFDLFRASYSGQVIAMAAEIGSVPEKIGQVKIQWSALSDG